jgi:hypothetical protein
MLMQTYNYNPNSTFVANLQLKISKTQSSLVNPPNFHLYANYVIIWPGPNLY